MISGQCKKVELDQNGNLRVETEYTLTDGSKTTGHTRYSCQNFSKEAIAKDVKQNCETLMRKTWNLKQNQVLRETKVDDIAHQCSSVEIVSKPAVYDKDGKVVTAEEKITIDDK